MTNPMPDPEERPDLYDDYNGQRYSPTSAEHLSAITPDHMKQLMEKRQGKPFAEIARAMETNSWRTASMYIATADGEVFRRLNGQNEKFHESTGRFVTADRNVARMGVPVTFEKVRPLLRNTARLDDVGRPLTT